MQYEMIIQPALWVATICIGLVFGARALRVRKKGESARTSLKVAVAALAAAVVVVPALGIVPPGHRGVVYNVSGGLSLDERGEGVTILVPWVQHMREISVRTQKVYSSKVFSQSLDLQEITVVASVNFHVEADQAADLYQEVGLMYRDTVIEPALFQRMKAAIGKVKAEDFAANRGALATTVQRQLTEQLSTYGIIVEYVNVEDAIFDPQFVQAVKEKVIAEQEAAEQERLIAAEAAIKQQVIIQAEGRARSVVVEANAQANANEVLARSITPVLLRWQWLVKWDGMLPGTLVGGAEDATLLLDGSQSLGYGG